MRSETGRRAVRLAAGLAAALAVVPLGADVIERILAVVDGRPLMLSEVRLLQQVRGLQEAAAIEALVDERLMLREASRLPQAAVSAEEAERAYQSLRERHAAEVAGLSEDDLRRVARRQTAILKYVEFRFRPQVRVTDDDVRGAYAEAYADRADAPPFDAVVETLREREAARVLDERIEAWVKELRQAAEIRYNP